MRKLVYSLLAIAFSLTACQDRWEDYYGEEEATDNGKSILETLAGMPDYSIYYGLLKETGMDSLLMRNQILTVWAPKNDFMPSDLASMSIDDKRLMVQNHINMTMVNRSIFNSVSQLESVNGKFLRVSKEPDAINLNPVTQFDILCRNGVINTIDGCMEPKRNVYQFLDALSDNYSIFRDTLLSYNDTVFHPELSKIIDYNEFGQPVFDSVFIIENDFAEDMNLMDESARYTLFVPSNNVIEKMYTQTSDYFRGIGYPIISEDSTNWFNWIKDASLYMGELAYGPNKTFKSINGNVFKTDYQQVDEDFIQCSNGKVFKMTEYYIPRYPDYFDTSFFETQYLPKIQEEDPSTTYFKIPAGCKLTVGPYSGNDFVQNCGAVQGTGEGPLFIEFKTIYKSLLADTCNKVKVLPGTYSLYGNLFGKGTYGPDSISIYVNDMFIKTLSGWQIPEPSMDPEKLPRLCEEIVVSDTFDMLRIKIVDEKNGYRELSTFKSSPKIVPGLFKLVPSVQNY